MAIFDVTLEPKAAFYRALAQAKHGDKIIYCIDKSCKGPHKGSAMNAYHSGLVTLVQQREKNSRFMYIAQRTVNRKNQKNEQELRECLKE